MLASRPTKVNDREAVVRIQEARKCPGFSESMLNKQWDNLHSAPTASTILITTKFNKRIVAIVGGLLIAEEMGERLISADESPWLHQHKDAFLTYDDLRVRNKARTLAFWTVLWATANSEDPDLARHRHRVYEACLSGWGLKNIYFSTFDARQVLKAESWGAGVAKTQLLEGHGELCVLSTDLTQQPLAPKILSDVAGSWEQQPPVELTDTHREVARLAYEFELGDEAIANILETSYTNVIDHWGRMKSTIKEKTGFVSPIKANRSAVLSFIQQRPSVIRPRDFYSK